MRKIVVMLMVLGIGVSSVTAAGFGEQAITGASDVLTDGTFVEAKNYTDGDPVTSVTVNGITFAQADATGWSYDISNAPGFSNPSMKVGSWDTDVFYTGGTPFGDMLNSAVWLAGSGDSTGTTMSYTLTGLTENTNYRVQMFMADMRDGFNHPFSVSVDGGTPSHILTVGILAPAPGIAVRVDVYFSTGAADTDAVITFIGEEYNITGGNGGPMLSAYALHMLSRVGDFDGDDFVDLQDFAVFSRRWQDTCLLPPQTLPGPGITGKIPSTSRESIVGTKDYVPRPHIFCDPNWFHWGGSCIQGDDGQYHLFYSRWPDPMSNWLYLGQICHATASTPEGPYQFESVVLEGPGDDPVGRWDAYNAVNPYITRFVDPADQQLKYYLYFVANRDDNDSGISDWYDRISKQRIGVAIANNPEGPWVRYAANPVCVPDNMIVHWYATNPAVCQLPDGRFLMLVKGRTGQTTSAGYVTGWALADSPTGPFVIQDTLAIPSNLRAEDPCVWIQDGTIYSAVKDWYGDISGVGGIAWLRGEIDNGMIKWENITGEAARISPRVIQWDDGQITALNRLERPFVMLDAAGKPEYLFCAASVEAPSASSPPVNVCFPLEQAVSSEQRVNIALSKPAVSSSVWAGNDSYAADKAVDGLTSTMLHTAAADTTPYCEVDLEGVEPLRDVVIVNRPGFAGRLRDIRIEVLDSQRQRVYLSDLLNPGNVLGGGVDDYGGDEPAELSLTFPDGIEGAYIRITRTTEGVNDDECILTLVEVEVHNSDFFSDFDGNGTVNFSDLAILISNWLL